MPLYTCTSSRQEVGQHEEALLCVGCNQWQHQECYSFVSWEQYQTAVRNCEIDRWCARCRSRSLHDFFNEVSDFEPPVGSIHLSDLPAALSPSSHSDIDVDTNTTILDVDYFSAAPLANSITTTPDANSFAAATDADSITTSSYADTSDSSMPSLDDVDLASSEVLDLLSEESLDDSVPHGTLATVTAPFEYCIVSKATMHENDMLIDSKGYSYIRKLAKKGSSRTSVLWRCSVHNKSHECHATVTQKGDIFVPGCHKHS